MKIIYRYLTQELILPFLFGVAAFVGIFVGTDLLFRLTEYYTTWGVGVITLVQLFFLSLPSIIVVTFPMAMLLATIMSFSRMAGDSEITAFRAGGVSVYRLVLPALIAGLLLSVITVGINELVVPRANYIYEQIVWQFKHGERMPKTQNNLYLTPLDPETNRPDYILYAHRFNGDTATMQDVILQEYEQGKPTTLIEAQSAKWLSDGWHFFNGMIFHLQAGERIPALKFEEYEVQGIFQRPEEISRISKKTGEMNMEELTEYIRMMEKQGKEMNKEWVEWHQRLSIPFASFIFVLLAAPLGIKPRRSGGSAMGLGLSIVVIFIYYVLMTVGDALGGQGTIPPWLGAWLQNIVFLVIGSILLYRTGR